MHHKYYLNNQIVFYNFDVFIGLKDKIEYIIYNNKCNNFSFSLPPTSTCKCQEL